MAAETVAARRWPIGVLGGLVFGAGAAWLALAVAAGGHGSYLPAAILFPYSMAISALAGSISPILAALALVQYPVYGATTVLAGRRRRAWLALAVLHVVSVAVAVTLVLRSEAFR